MNFRSAVPRVLLILPLVAACRPEIGDACDVSNDCAESSERLCDPTQPGGYCTIFNCEPGGCPEEGICIAFGSDLSPAAGCKDPNGNSRFRRTFCMRSCERNSDCRSGYVCSDLSTEGNPWGATIAETRSVSGRVCVAKFTAAPVAPDATSDICRGRINPGASGGAGAGGEGGVSGAGGGAGQGGSTGGSTGQGGTGGGQGGGGAGQSGGGAGGN